MTSQNNIFETTFLDQSFVFCTELVSRPTLDVLPPRSPYYSCCRLFTLYYIHSLVDVNGLFCIVILILSLITINFFLFNYFVLNIALNHAFGRYKTGPCIPLSVELNITYCYHPSGNYTDE